MNKKLPRDFRRKYNMIAVATLYLAKPDDSYFKKFSEKAKKGIKLLAASLEKHLKDGDIDEKR